MDKLIVFTKVEEATKETFVERKPSTGNERLLYGSLASNQEAE